MSASASVYTLTPPSFMVEPGPSGLRVWIWLPQFALLLIGLAEVERLEQGPVMGINWIGSVGHPVVYTKLLLVDLAGGQQETRFA
jgi:hypothetical protein